MTRFLPTREAFMGAMRDAVLIAALGVALLLIVAAAVVVISALSALHPMATHTLLMATFVSVMGASLIHMHGDTETWFGALILLYSIIIGVAVIGGGGLYLGKLVAKAIGLTVIGG